MERHTRVRIATLFVAAAAALCPGWASAVYVYNYINFPNATDTDVWGINNAGQIAVNAGNGITSTASIYTSGVFTPLPALPAGLAGGAIGLNDAGTVVGRALPEAPPNIPSQGSILRGSTYEFFSHPNWLNTQARAIGNSGIVTGFADNGNPDAVGGSIGFIYNPATRTFTDIIPPTGANLTIAQGINAAGQVVGSFRDATGNTAFLREANGTITTFRVNNQPTAARAINDNGLIAGFLGRSGGLIGFVGNSNGYELLSIAGAAQTIVEGMNNAGQVSGFYYDALGHTHGFIGTPASLPTSVTNNGAFVFNVNVIPNTPIFIDPLVTTGYDYATGLGDPLFATVQLPIGIGDNLYTLLVGNLSFALAAGDWFDFRAHGFTQGVSAFSVRGIETSAALDPTNPQAFVTGLTFMSAGRFTGTMAPVTTFVPEPAALALVGLGLAGLALRRRVGQGRKRATTGLN